MGWACRNPALYQGETDRGPGEKVLLEKASGGQQAQLLYGLSVESRLANRRARRIMAGERSAGSRRTLMT
jgi:hypothetical protein